MEQKIVKSTTLAIDDLIRLVLLGEPKLSVDYDKEADVLYVSFGQPKKADNAYEEDGVIRRMSKSKIVGLTVLDASRFLKRKS